MLRRLRGEGGFGLVELLIAMALMNVAFLALFATFTSGTIVIRHAARISTASALADAQMELYRGLTYSTIALDSSTIPSSSPYTTDSAYSASQVTATCSGTVSAHNECNASRSLTGPDGHPYRVDTYITTLTPTSGRAGKLVTVVVRDGSTLTSVLARVASDFDASTGS
jgi:Tfp pilus assembly protein PilE